MDIALCLNLIDECFESIYCRNIIIFIHIV